MAPNLRVGLEVRPPLAVEKNHPGKREGGKWCCGILSPFQISWEEERWQSTKTSNRTRESLLIFASQWFENGDKLR
jgi:hypothetical protein